MSSEKKPFKEWIKENENKWIIGGIITICFAVLMPVAIFFFSKSSLSFDSFAKLGTVGDFLGGSTVGFFFVSQYFVFNLYYCNAEKGIRIAARRTAND